MLLEMIKRIPEGFSEGCFRGRKYGISKRSFNDERSFKIFAEEFGGNDFISLNFYLTTKDEKLRPCEMPEAKVIDFLRNVIISS